MNAEQGELFLIAANVFKSVFYACGIVGIVLLVKRTLKRTPRPPAGNAQRPPSRTPRARPKSKLLLKKEE